jgi:hypothetical protein
MSHKLDSPAHAAAQHGTLRPNLDVCGVLLMSLVRASLLHRIDVASKDVLRFRNRIDDL